MAPSQMQQPLTSRRNSFGLTSLVSHLASIISLQGQIPEFEIAIANTGHTLAHEVKYYKVIRILPFPLPDDYPFPEIDYRPVSTVSIVAQEEYRCRVQAHQPLSLEYFSLVKRGQSERLYLIGIIKYLDIFGGAHTTKFCICVQGPVPEPAPGVQVTFYRSQIHNETD